MDKIICWNCELEFSKVNAKTRWVASAFEGEDICVYVCPVCDAAQYGYEVFLVSFDDLEALGIDFRGMYYSSGGAE